MPIDAPSAAPDGLEICLFGRLKLSYDGVVMGFNAPAKAASLLGYLIINRGEPVSRDSIAFMLWPDDEESKARANLRRHVLLLQRTLPDPGAIPWMISDRGTLRWNPDAVAEIDLVTFERLSRDEVMAENAADRYGGDLLADLYDDWILPQRERLRQIQSGNLESIVERSRRNREFAKGIVTAQALLAHDPWREDTVRTLMSLRYESGDRAGALQEFDRFAHRLRDEMDVAPMPDTVARYDSIVRNAPALGSHGSVPAERKTTPATSSMPFVGRDAEITRLQELWGRAARGHGRMVVLNGEAGIGKSRLVAELGAVVETQGGRVISGGTTFPESTPFQAIVESLRGALPEIAELDIKPVWLAAAATVLPELRQAHPGLPRLALLPPDRQQSRLFEALAGCIEGISLRRPLLVVLEDLHWSGATTVAFLEYIARRVQTNPILLVATYREDEATRAHPLRDLRRRLSRTDTIATMHLGRLTLGDIERFAALLPELGPRAMEFASHAHGLSDGNPFFLAELVESALAADGADAGLPTTIETAVGTRLARLSEDAAILASIAAVIGRAFDIEMLAGVSGMEEAVVLRCLDELLDLRLVREAGVKRASSRFDFVFSHDLIARHMYARVPQDVRRRRHHRVGIVMQELHADSIESISPELAHHFDEGGDRDRAAAYYRVAARRALESYADDEALSALSRAIELDDGAGHAFGLLEMRENVYGRRGLRELQRADIDEIDRLAQAAGDVEHIGECLRKRIELARATDDAGALARHLDELDGFARRGGSDLWKALALEARARQHVATGNYADGVRLARRALPLFERTKDAPGLVRTLCLIADASTLQERTTQATEALARAVVHAHATENEPLVVRTLSAASLAAYVNTDYVRAHDLAQQGLDICRAIGDREGEADFLLRLGNIESRRFAIDESIALFSSALRIYESLGKRQGEAAILVNRGLLLIKVGQYEDALDAFRRARVIFSQSNDLRGLTICAINVGMVAFLQRRYESARRLSRRAVELSTRLGMPHLLCVSLGNLGASERELFDLENAVTHSEEALRLRRRIAPADIGSDLADMGLTYLRTGELRKSSRLADEIARLGTPALNSVIFPQNVLWIAAQIYRDAQKPDRYLDLLARAARSRDERLALVPEGSWRDRYRALPFNGEIQSALEAL